MQLLRMQTWQRLSQLPKTIAGGLQNMPKGGVQPWLGAGFYLLLFVFTSHLNLPTAWQVCVYLVVALLMIIHASIDNRGALYGAFAILPSLQAAMLLVRVETISRTNWALLLSYFLFVCVLVVRRAFAYGRHEVGLALAKKRTEGRLKRFAWGALGLAIQLLIGIIGAYVLRVLWRMYPQDSALLEVTGQQINAVNIMLLFLTGLTEEFYFRGLFQRAAKSSLGVVGGLIFPSLLAAFMYALWQSPLLGLFQLVTGLLLGVVALVSGSALGVGVARGLANISLIMSFTSLARYLLETSVQTIDIITSILRLGRSILENIL